MVSLVLVHNSHHEVYGRTGVQVFAALRSDFSTRRRERCVRVDFTAGLITGVDELERLLREAFKATFEARAAAYDEEVSCACSGAVPALRSPSAMPYSSPCSIDALLASDIT